MDQLHRKAVIVYDQDLHEPNADGRSTRTIGTARLECEIEIVIDLHSIVRHMGERACKSAGGKCRDGHVMVKRVGKPRELSRANCPAR